MEQTLIFVGKTIRVTCDLKVERKEPSTGDEADDTKIAVKVYVNWLKAMIPELLEEIVTQKIAP